MLTIESPSVAAGDLVLCYDGGANQIADVRLDRATLTAASAKMFLVQSAPSGAAHISYTTGAPGSVSSTKAADTCRTTIQIRLAEGSGALGALKLYQTEASAGQQLKLVLDAGTTPLDVEVHTDALPNGATNRLPEGVDDRRRRASMDGDHRGDHHLEFQPGQFRGIDRKGR